MSAGNDKRAPDLDELAKRFATLGEFFTGLGDREQAGRVVDAIRADEPTAFRELIDPLPDFPGKCHSLCTAVRTLVEEERYVKQKMCRLRWNLTREERLLAARIHWKHFGTRPTVFEPTTGLTEVTPVIDEWLGPSAYRDELEANGLVECEEKDVLAPPLIGPPSWECVDLCAP
jgi:hypothetical protein